MQRRTLVQSAAALVAAGSLPGCAIPSRSMTPKTLAYVSCAESGELLVYELDGGSGALREVQRLAPGGMLMPIAISPDQRKLYVARRSEPLSVLAFAIDPKNGQLSALGQAPLAHSMAYLSTDKAGRWLFGASYGGNLIATNPIDANGMPQAPKQVIPTGANAHCIRADISNRHVFATSLGASQVGHWRFDAASGELRPGNAPLQLPAGSGSRHFVFGPGERFVYLLGELDASITVLALDADSGRLTAQQTVSSLPPGFAGKPWASDLHLTPDGGFLYSSERRSNTLARFSVDAKNGQLTPLGHVAAEQQPRGFAIDPSGRFLLCAGQLSHHVGSYAIDGATGALSPIGRVPAGRDPNWIEILQLAS